MDKLNKRHQDILDSLRSLGGEASIREIAHDTELSVNGVSQSLGSTSLSSYVQRIPHDGKWQGAEERYRAVDAETPHEPEAQGQLF